MQRVQVPVDMISEQKNILGMISTRQAIYLAIGAVILYAYIPSLYSLIASLLGIIVAIVICALTAIPVIIFVLYLAFYKSSKHNMFGDRLLLIRLQKKSQFGYWHKGR